MLVLAHLACFITPPEIELDVSPKSVTSTLDESFELTWTLSVTPKGDTTNINPEVRLEVEGEDVTDASPVVCDPAVFGDVGGGEDWSERTNAFVCSCEREGLHDALVYVINDEDNKSQQAIEISCNEPVSTGSYDIFAPTYQDEAAVFRVLDFFYADLEGAPSVVAKTPTGAIACGNSGCFETDDGGLNWAPHEALEAVSSPKSLVHLEDGGILTSDGSELSRLFDEELLPLFSGTDLQLWGFEKGGAYARTGEGGDYTHHSSDDGLTWLDWDSDVGIEKLTRFGALLVGEDVWWGVPVYSADGGHTWIRPEGLPAEALVSTATDGERVVLAFPSSLWVSTDGMTFTEVEGNFPGGYGRVVHNNGHWYVHSDTVWASPDLATWTSSGEGGVGAYTGIWAMGGVPDEDIPDTGMDR